MTTAEEIKAEYTSSLADLTFNSKPLINVLTMLAEENLPNAKIIVEAIEEHLSKVATDIKLPILYLIDCIVKNVGQTYTGLFSQNIVSTFCSVFKMVDEKTRSEMFKLRQTWNDVFPQTKLYAIDVQINMIDPAWPVTANSIHLNPKFLKNSPAVTEPVVPIPKPLVKAVPQDIDKETLLMQEQLIQKQKELLELQRKTLELEVLQTRVKLQEQMKAGVTPVSTNILLKPEVAKQLIPEAMAKPKQMSMPNSLLGQRTQNSGSSQPKINPVNSTLAAAKPIRDPRLLRQQQQQQKLQQKAIPHSQQTGTSSASVTLTTDGSSHKSSVVENSKNVTNKLGVKDIPKDPRLSNKFDKKMSKSFPKSREHPTADLSQKTNKFSSRISDKSDSERPGSPKPSSNSSNSVTSSSSSSLDSPRKKDKSRSSKHKKRDRSEVKRSQEGEGSPNKRDKIVKTDDSDNEYNKNGSGLSSFKSVKTSAKNRNYVRRNMVPSPPVPIQLEVMEASFIQVKPSRTQLLEEKTEQTAPTSDSNNKPMDSDLRQLPNTNLSKKRTSTEASDQAAKKSRSFDVLFGSEDTDLRQLPPTIVDRPPTPPPPIISSETIEKHLLKKNDLDAIRAKLANATNRDKIMSKSFHKSKLHQEPMGDTDLRLSIAKASPAMGLKNKITISPEEEKVIRSGNMTKEQEQKFWNKFLMQIEKEKLREAKKKDHEESFGEPISDEEFESPNEYGDPQRKPQNSQQQMPFNDKDERINMPGVSPLQQSFEPVPPVRPPPQFYPRGGRPPFRGNQNWRGRGRMPLPPRQPIRWHQQPHPRWRNMQDGSYDDDSSSRSPGQDFGPQELTVLQEDIKTLNIDGVPRDVRVYDDTAIIFLNWDDPREISFQSGDRRVIFNNKESYILSFGAPYKECMINGRPFNVKLGAPSREIFINDIGFECIFGNDPIFITVNGVNLSVQLEGPPPQVKIGDVKRADLVVGKISLIIDAKIIVPVFLDARLQRFIVDGEQCTLIFVDALKRVLINDVPFNVEFGGLPKPFTIHGNKHFIRFSVLPKGIKPGHVKIRNMQGDTTTMSPSGQDENGQEVVSGPLEIGELLRPESSKVTQPVGRESPDNRSNSPSFFNNILQSGLNNLDVISNIFSQNLAPASATPGYQVEIPGIESNTEAKDGVPVQIAQPVKPPININELFEKLVASGFVKTQDQPTSVPVTNSSHVTHLPTPVNTSTKKIQVPKAAAKKHNVDDPNAAKVQKRPLSEILKPVTFSRPETLKVRQSPLYVTLYTGMQCSSCGMRFPPEASILYSQHLDWHFRQNRRGKKNARVASSRKWYYSLTDWKNYEEIEDLEEREKNYFDQQQQAEVAEEGEEEVEIPTVPADPGRTDEICDVCRDTFEQFFNEEKEEWHLRNAIKINDKTYHPVCYEDKQQSIMESSLDESKIEGESAQPQNKLIPGLEIILDDDDEDEEPKIDDDDVVSLAESEEEKEVEEKSEEPQDDDGDDDDVILNEVAPIKIVVDDDDDDDLPMNEQAAKQPMKFKREKHVEDDGFVDVGDLVSLSQVGQIKIKSEPLDDDELHSTTLDTSAVCDLSEPTTEPQTPVADLQSEPIASHPQLITSIDGNVELVSSAPSVPTTLSGGTKIKINISKPLPVITPKDVSETSDNSVLVDNTSSETAVVEPDIVNYKPALHNVPLKKLAPIKKGNELTGLCSIM